MIWKIEKKYSYRNTNEKLYWLSDGSIHFLDTQQFFDFVYKEIDFKKIHLNTICFFSNKKTNKDFIQKSKLHNDYCYLSEIQKNNLSFYNWMVENIGKGFFNFIVYYDQKEEFKKHINKAIAFKIKEKFKSKSNQKRL